MATALQRAPQLPLAGDLFSMGRRSAACTASRLSFDGLMRQGWRQTGLSKQRWQPHQQPRCAVAAPAASAPVVPTDQTGINEAGLGEADPNARFAIAYQGVPGAYSEVAALASCPGWRHLPCDQFEQVFQSLSQWSADRAVLPIENSLGGTIHENLDLLMRYQLHIVGEVLVDVNHCLLALPGTRKEDLVRVISHPQALAQTDSYLRQLPNKAGVREAVSDTAGAAQAISANQWRDVGAVASARAAELYGLDILDRNIQDNKDNVTRFIVLAREPQVIKDHETMPGVYKTSVVFSLQERPGILHKALTVFALRDINLCKIESRPLKTAPLHVESDNNRRLYRYLFFVDFDGSTAEELVQNALRNLQEFATFLRVLGSYPVGA